MAAAIARMHEMMNSAKPDERFDQCRAAPSADTGATAVKKSCVLFLMK